MFVSSARIRTAELMDQPGLDRAAHRHALTALGRTAVISRTGSSIWPVIRRAALQQPDRPLRVLDIACGGGQVTIDIARRMETAGIAGEVLGCDVSPVALDYARALATTVNAERVAFTQLDVLRDPWPTGFDVVLCSLFLHHLSDEETVVVLRRMADAAARLVVVSDLRRTDLGYLMTWVGGRLLSRSHVFHVDGLRSVKAAFTSGEALALAHAAGLQTATVSHCWPQRFLLTWTRTTL
jgi:2-polyprenyl-3-methyl-5-hydroxy-6-metoxy-1,4-benzoquinol methylase